MKKAGLLESTRRGYFRITSRGLELLKQKPQTVNVKLLKQYPEFVQFHKGKNSAEPKIVQAPQESDERTPGEAIEAAYKVIRDGLAAELLEQIMKSSPSFFEDLVLDLLVKMGYGGTRRDAAKAVGKSGDEGIDGIINEDLLGLDVIYIQAKRWGGTVSRPEVQKFVGALQGQRAKRGVFITTSGFSKGALEYVSMLESNVVLKDGETLADLMIDNDVGVSRIATYEIKRVDSDYFNEV